MGANTNITAQVRVVRAAMVGVMHGYIDETNCVRGSMWKRGLCSQIEQAVDRHDRHTTKEEDKLNFGKWARLVNLYEGWMKEWEHSTKNETYPVPAPHDYEQGERDIAQEKAPGYSYYMACVHGEAGHNMYEGEYGGYRLELARFIYNKCEDFLNQKEQRP